MAKEIDIKMTDEEFEKLVHLSFRNKELEIEKFCNSFISENAHLKSRALDTELRWELASREMSIFDNKLEEKLFYLLYENCTYILNNQTGKFLSTYLNLNKKSDILTYIEFFYCTKYGIERGESFDAKFHSLGMWKLVPRIVRKVNSIEIIVQYLPLLIEVMILKKRMDELTVKLDQEEDVENEVLYDKVETNDSNATTLGLNDILVFYYLLEKHGLFKQIDDRPDKLLVLEKLLPPFNKPKNIQSGIDSYYNNNYTKNYLSGTNNLKKREELAEKLRKIIDVLETIPKKI